MLEGFQSVQPVQQPAWKQPQLHEVDIEQTQSDVGAGIDGLGGAAS